MGTGQGSGEWFLVFGIAFCLEYDFAVIFWQGVTKHFGCTLVELFPRVAFRALLLEAMETFSSALHPISLTRKVQRLFWKFPFVRLCVLRKHPYLLWSSDFIPALQPPCSSGCLVFSSVLAILTPLTAAALPQAQRGLTSFLARPWFF